MRVLLQSSAILCLIAAAPATARDGAWYVGGDFGAVTVPDNDFDVGAPGNDSLALHYHLGIDTAAFVGYDLGAFRLEAEVSYRRASVDSFTTTEPLHNTSGILHPPGTHDAAGSASALSFMLNGMLDFGDDDGLSGFVGGGVGVARVDYSDVRAATNDGAFLDDADTRFAWQIVAGVRQAVSRDIDVHLRYRFFNTGGLEFDPIPGGAQIDGRFRSHSVLGGITFNFGGPSPR